MNFEGIQWHDSEILSIKIDRSSPGYKDEIEILMITPNEEKFLLIFKECYKIKMNLNMGIITGENILDANWNNEEEINRTISESKLSNYVKDRLKYFKIETNTTGGTIEIYYFTEEINKI